MATSLNRDFYNPIKKRADTAKLSLRASEVSRVLKCAAEHLASLPSEQALSVIAMWLRKHGASTKRGT
jgi:hypothetical protein